MGLYLALLYPFHTTGRKFLSSLFWFFGWFFLFCFVFFLVYWKTKNISLHFYLPASFSEPSNCMISDNREIYDVTSQKTTANSLESVSQPQARGHAASMLGCRRWPRDRCRASTLRDVWFYCEVNCMNIVTEEKKKSSRNRHDFILSKSSGEILGGLAGWSLLSHHPDLGSSPWDRCRGAMWHVKLCLALSFIFLIT